MAVLFGFLLGRRSAGPNLNRIHPPVCPQAQPAGVAHRKSVLGKTKLFLLLAGLALLGWYLSRADLQAVGEAMRRLGWLAPIILLPYFVVYMVDCVAWRWCFPPRLDLPFLTLFRIRWTGEAVNNVLPSGTVGGEAVKVYLLRKRGVASRVGTSSVVVGRTAQTTAQLVYLLVAALMLLRLAGDQPGLRAGMLALLTSGTMALAGFFWVQQRGLFASALALMRILRVNFRFLEKHHATLLDLDHAITGFYRERRGRFFTATGFYLVGWLVDTLEIYLVAALVGMPITWAQALAVEAFTSVVKIVGLWIPGTLGVQESGILVLGRLAGLPDTLSVAYALLRRGREVLFALIGWMLLYADHTSLRTIRAETAMTNEDPALPNHSPKPS
jgi:glycosyltransferase 2 family protein